MLCSSCKNPIKVNDTVCEWCGTNCVNQNDRLSKQESKANGLDTELINLLSKNSNPNGSVTNIVPARKLYQETTGKSKYESIYYVSRLNFFRTHKHASESAWQVEWGKTKKKMKMWVWGSIFAPIYLPIGIFFFHQLKQFKKHGL